jgi:poly(hydroxyalkanoate) granule-associated protein
MSSRKKSDATRGPDAAGAGPHLAEDVKEAARRVWLAGLGAFSHAREGGEHAFRALVARGREFEKRARPTVEALSAKARDLLERARASGRSSLASVDAQASSALADASRLLKQEAGELGRRLQALSRKIEGLEESARSRVGRAARAPKAARTPASRSRKTAARRAPTARTRKPRP